MSSGQLSFGDDCPIGVFDSGIGGLSILKEIHQLLPHENLIYVGDSLHAPYGDRSAEYVRERSQHISDFLLDQGVKTIVVACNTATAEAATQLRATMDIPVIGLEPAIKPASRLSKNGVIGVLATQRTINSKRLLGLTEKFANDKKVIAQACPGLVEQVEACNLEGAETIALLNQYIQPLIDQGTDALILGCTHYPFLLSSIRAIVGEEIEILETGKPVARQIQRILQQNQLERGILNFSEKSNYKPKLTFYNSSENPQQRSAMQELWGKNITINTLPELS